jgi:hypothetical protein
MEISGTLNSISVKEAGAQVGQRPRVALIVRLWAGDQSDVICFVLSALAVTEYASAADQAWDIVTDVPPATSELQRDFCPSPQSNWYWTESPFGSVVEAAKE